MSYRILAAEASHWGEVTRLIESASLPLDGLADQFPDAYAVALRGDDLVGVAGLERYASVGLLRSVAVAPSARGTGVGRALVLDRLAHARDRQIHTAYLLTTTAPEFFEHLGFSRILRHEVSGAIAQSVEFATACPASAICLQRRP